MKISGLLLGVTVCCLFFYSVTASAETADQAFARGDALLAAGEFEPSLTAYAAAVRAERTNQQYNQQYMLVRRIITLRQNLDREQDKQKWQQTAQALHAFYTSKGIYREALVVAEKIHAKLNTAFTATQLAETQLAMGQNDAATDTIALLDPARITPAAQALHAIALARQGKLEEAKQISAEISGTQNKDPGTLYNLARMHAVIGNQAQSLALLTQCFQTVPPSRIDNLKQHAQLSPEFASLTSSEGFAKSLQTVSKVAESKCSGGSSCAGCPMRGNCPMSQGK